MVRQIGPRRRLSSGITFRAVILGLILIPVNTYFLMANLLRYWATLPTTISLIYNVIITLTILTALNLLIERFLPRFALKRGELLTIYIMLSVSSAIGGHDGMQTIVPTVPSGFWFATPENEWEALFWRYLPSWLTTDDFLSARDFFHGETSFYTGGYLRHWLRPIFWWTALLTMLVWTMICLDLILQKQWIERERLTYPIIQLPLELTQARGRFFRSKAMWIGFAIAGGINLINGLHALLPACPEIPVRSTDIGKYFTEKPWNAIGWTPLYILPFAVGIGFLMPSEMSLSLWFFYLFWKGERILGSALGLHSLPGFPYDGPQGIGAYLAVALLAIVGGRRHISAILRGLFRSRPRDGDRPAGYRWAVFGLIGGLIFLIIFSYQGGMAVWTAAVYFLVYFLFAISISRIRAEVGPPTHEMFDVNPRHFLVDAVGTRRISRGGLAMMSLYFAFNRGYRAHPMPHTLEGFKLAEEARMEQNRLVSIMLLATVIGVLSAFWAYLAEAHRYGFINTEDPEIGSGGFESLKNWLHNPTKTDVPAVAFMCVGFFITGIFWWLRRRFIFWPFHPAGYAVASSTWTFGWLWFSIFISWAIKTVILKFGGIGLYRKARPIFLGLLLGEFIIGGGWVVFRLFTNIQVYSFYR
jgi:hypothetical protein